MSEMSMSIVSPTPFCPSFEPWAKLTNADEPISVVLIHVFGYLFQRCPGCSKNVLFLLKRWMRCIAPKASTKPIIGEVKSDSKTSSTFFVGIMVEGSIVYIAIETPRIDPIRVCELDAGIPRNHVPKFQIIAERSSAMTTHTQKYRGWRAMISSGKRWIIPIATVMPPSVTQRKLKNAAKITDFFGEREFV